MFDFMSGWFAQLQGLPLHPLVVHAVVVLVPIAAIAMIVAIAVPKWRSPLKWWALGGLTVGFVGVYLAKLSGDSLSAAVGLPTFHAEWGNNLVPLALGLLVVSALWVWSTLDGAKPKLPARARSIVGSSAAVLVCLAGVATLAMTYVVGHSGAEAAWKDTLTEARRAPASAATVRSPITMQQVKARDTADDCWSVVDGVVYDMTDFIARHPAGPKQVRAMCGKDATKDFNGTHAGQAEAEGWLEVFRIGELAKD